MVGDRVAKLQAEIDGVEAALAEAVEESPTQRLDAARAALVGARGRSGQRYSGRKAGACP